jgi:hypothetical protein
VVWHSSAAAWAGVTVLLIVAPWMGSQMARHWIVGAAVVIYGFGAIANAWVILFVTFLHSENKSHWISPMKQTKATQLTALSGSWLWGIRQRLKLFAAVLLATIFSPASSLAQATKPNILVDDIGCFNPSCYHQGIIGCHTPNIDRPDLLNVFDW